MRNRGQRRWEYGTHKSGRIIWKSSSFFQKAKPNKQKTPILKQNKQTKNKPQNKTKTKPQTQQQQKKSNQTKTKPNTNAWIMWVSQINWNLKLVLAITYRPANHSIFKTIALVQKSNSIHNLGRMLYTTVKLDSFMDNWGGSLCYCFLISEMLIK